MMLITRVMYTQLVPHACARWCMNEGVMNEDALVPSETLKSVSIGEGAMSGYSGHENELGYHLLRWRN